MVKVTQPRISHAVWKCNVLHFDHPSGNFDYITFKVVETGESCAAQLPTDRQGGKLNTRWLAFGPSPFETRQCKCRRPRGRRRTTSTSQAYATRSRRLLGSPECARCV